MLDLMGKGYIIQHCVALTSKQTKEKIFQIYVTDALQAIVDNTARQYGGKVMNLRYADLITEQKTEKKQPTEDEIISGLKAKLRKNKHGRYDTQSDIDA